MMESTIVRLARLENRASWGYSAHSQDALEVENKLKSSKYPASNLGDHTTGLAGGLTPRGANYPDSGVIFIRVGNIQPEGLDLSGVVYIDEEMHNGELRRCQLQSGDVLLAITGATFGKACVVPSDIGQANINQHIVRIHTRPELNPYYLALFFNSELGTKQSLVWATGGTRPALDYTAIRSMRIPLPPRPIQDRIAQVMQEAYATRREKLAEAETFVEGINQFLLKELQIDFAGVIGNKRFKIESSLIVGNRFDVDFHLPQIRGQYQTLKEAENYKLIPLGELVEQIANGATPKGANYQTEGIPFFRIQNITPNGIDLSDVRYILRDTHEEMKRSQTKPGDLLMTITGRVGTAAVVPETIKEGNINQHIVILRLKPGVIDVHYLAAVINSSVVEFQAKHRTTGTTRIALDYSAVKSLLIPVPPMKTQKSLTEAIAYRRNEAKRLRAQAEAVVAGAKARVERMILGKEEAA